MSRLGFELTMSVFKLTKAFRALNRSATVIGRFIFLQIN
jgi:hypothetical protein